MLGLSYSGKIASPEERKRAELLVFSHAGMDPQGEVEACTSVIAVANPRPRLQRELSAGWHWCRRKL